MTRRLARLFGAGELQSSTAGQWLIPDQGLILDRGPGTQGSWSIKPYPWLDRHRRVMGEQELERLWRSREQWLTRHGLDQAQFARRRDALTAVEHALRHDPLPQLDWIWADD